MHFPIWFRYQLKIFKIPHYARSIIQIWRLKVVWLNRHLVLIHRCWVQKFAIYYQSQTQLINLNQIGQKHSPKLQRLLISRHFQLVRHLKIIKLSKTQLNSETNGKSSSILMTNSSLKCFLYLLQWWWLPDKTVT